MPKSKSKPKSMLIQSLCQVYAKSMLSPIHAKSILSLRICQAYAIVQVCAKPMPKSKSKPKSMHIIAYNFIRKKTYISNFINWPYEYNYFYGANGKLQIYDFILKSESIAVNHKYKPKFPI